MDQLNVVGTDFSGQVPMVLLSDRRKIFVPEITGEYLKEGDEVEVATTFDGERHSGTIKINRTNRQHWCYYF